MPSANLQPANPRYRLPATGFAFDKGHIDQSAAGRKHGIPIGFGVLTVDSIEQAIERAGTKAGNKGEEAALAIIETVNLLRRVD